MLRQLLPDMMLKDVIRLYAAPNPLDVLQLVAKHHNCDVTKVAVILVIDGLQNIFDNQHFKSTLTAIGDLTAQGPFIIPCCTATSSVEISDAFGLSSRPRVYLQVEPLELPHINGAPVFQTDPLTKILVNDCGGHGRALEILAETLAEVDIGQCSLEFLMADIRKRLLRLYHSAINWSHEEARSLILAVLTHQFLDGNSPLPNTQKTPERFVSAGLIRFVQEGVSGYFVVPYIWIWVIATQYKSMLNDMWRFDDHSYLIRDFDVTQDSCRYLHT